MSVNHVGLLDAPGWVCGRIEPDLQHIASGKTVPAYGSTEYRLWRGGHPDVDVRRRNWGFEGEAEALERAGFESFNVDVRRYTMHEPEAERVGSRKESQARSCSNRLIATRPAGGSGLLRCMCTQGIMDLMRWISTKHPAHGHLPYRPKIRRLPAPE